MLKIAVATIAVAMVPSFALADRIVRHADGSPIRVRVERKSAAPKLLMKKAAAAAPVDETDALLANWGVTNRVAELKERKRETDRYGRTHIRHRPASTAWCGSRKGGKSFCLSTAFMQLRQGQ